MERLTDKDLEFHQGVMEQLKVAQVAYNTWRAYLTHTYGLTDGDGVQIDGQIVRASRPFLEAVAPTGIA